MAHTRIPIEERPGRPRLPVLWRTRPVAQRGSLISVPAWQRRVTPADRRGRDHRADGPGGRVLKVHGRRSR